MSDWCMDCINHLFQPYYKKNGDTHDYCARTKEWVMCSGNACEHFDDLSWRKGGCCGSV